MYDNGKGIRFLILSIIGLQVDPTLLYTYIYIYIKNFKIK